MTETKNLSALETSSAELLRAFQPDGTLTFVNDACCRFYKKKPEEMVGHNLATFLSENEREEIIAAIFSITPENPEVITRPKYVRDDGEVRYLEYRNKGIFQPDGTIIGYQSIGTELASDNQPPLPFPKKQTHLEETEKRARTNITLQNKNIGIFSEEMYEVVRHAEMYHTDRSIPVLLEGETGVGKEIIAKTIHFGQSDSLLPFVDINCTALSPALFESELFGYDSGSFTGAVHAGRRGKLDSAHGGTLFLDEVAEIPIELQAKLLRVLEEKNFYRVGGLRRIATDIRVIAATNVDFDSCIGNGTFRKDLYYRLKVGHIRIPALRERPDDILPLARMMLKQFSQNRNKGFHNLSEATCELLVNHPWPGNIRELKNLIEWATFMYDAPLLLPKHIQHRLTIPGSVPQLTGDPPSAAPKKYKKDITRADLHNAINLCNGNKTKAARTLGISIRTLYNRLSN
ncbi:MAG: two-component system response regulator AtoC [Desulforhopalus sp.]|jgi:two-component system response regulator AtoC